MGTDKKISILQRTEATEENRKQARYFYKKTMYILTMRITSIKNKNKEFSQLSKTRTLNSYLKISSLDMLSGIRREDTHCLGIKGNSNDSKGSACPEVLDKELPIIFFVGNTTNILERGDSEVDSRVKLQLHL